jgi:hypothetical protein
MHHAKTPSKAKQSKIKFKDLATWREIFGNALTTKLGEMN